MEEQREEEGKKWRDSHREIFDDTRNTGGGARNVISERNTSVLVRARETSAPLI